MNCSKTNITFLKEGNSWKYKTYTFGFESGELALSVNGSNGDGFLTETTVLSIANNESITSTGLWRESGDFLLADAGDNKNAKIYKKNAQLGDTWMHDQADGGVSTHEVVALDSTITVPAGTFKCIVYKYSATDIINESHVFWNDEVGNIKEDAGFFSFELLEYSN